MIEEFKKFILKGNVIDLSTGVIIGAAFASIVTAFSKGIVEPILALAGGGSSPDLTIPLRQSGDKPIVLNLGILIGALISFLITAAVVFFVIIKPVNKLKSMMMGKDEVPPP